MGTLGVTRQLMYIGLILLPDVGHVAQPLEPHSVCSSVEGESGPL